MKILAQLNYHYGTHHLLQALFLRLAPSLYLLLEDVLFIEASLIKIKTTILKG